MASSEPLSEHDRLAAELVTTNFEAVERNDVRAKRAGDRVTVDVRVGYYWRTRATYDATALGAATGDAEVAAAREETYEVLAIDAE